MKRGWSQGQLAAYSGLTQSHISQIESGRRLRVEPETVSRLAAALDTSADYLLGLTDDPHPPSKEAEAEVNPFAEAPGDVMVEHLIDLLHRLPSEDRQFLVELMRRLTANRPSHSGE